MEEREKKEGTEGGQRWREDCDEEGGRDCQDLRRNTAGEGAGRDGERESLRSRGDWK